ncbi:C-type lectin domain family 17, member A-like [Oryzias melastigma]|uniref:C-type lectin domain family 17, member A-like n=1 Tax=Oryzias melastigma TaxID=30732 RepID=UPI00168D1C21|nr:C-type lectin domain family 17, member A-like [Oryzias melastigma]
MNSSLIETTKKLMDFEQGKTGCPVGWIYFRSSCYYFSGESGSWDKARNFCKNKGADLVVMNSREEKKFISAFKKKPVWIGLSDKAEEGTFKWVDGSPLTLKFWGGRQPDNGGGEHGEEDCVQFVFEYSGIWNDASCKTSSQGLCEKRAT